MHKYISSPDVFKFSSKVISCEPYKENLFSIELEESFFFPEAGGQPADRGSINNEEIL